MAAPEAVHRAWYSDTIERFCTDDPDRIVGRLTEASEFEVNPEQQRAWRVQRDLLRNVLVGCEGKLYLEFVIPRMGSRLDALVIIGPMLLVLEFKVGKSRFLSEDVDQVVDYALDLHHFHEGSHGVAIAPVLVATDARDDDCTAAESVPPDRLLAASKTNASRLARTLDRVRSLVRGEPIPIDAWERSSYKPTPTIIEATLALYRHHSVVEIARSDAGARNLGVTAGVLARIIREARERSEKVLCLVTGVPGAGKTLVGLNAATQHLDPDDDLYSVFLSGNGPLVAVLREALVRDRVERSKQEGLRVTKGAASTEVKAFIQNVHHFRDDCLADEKPPAEHVAIFDEAQRAWTREQTAKFMRQKKGRPDFDMSEPAFLISCLDRHHDWAAVVCLVGGGQEINTGEAGIGEWIAARRDRFPGWRIHLSDRVA